MTLRTCIGLCLIALLSACGQMGPLYLPDHAPAKKRPPQIIGNPQQPAPAPATPPTQAPPATATPNATPDASPAPNKETQ